MCFGGLEVCFLVCCYLFSAVFFCRFLGVCVCVLVFC